MRGKGSATTFYAVIFALIVSLLLLAQAMARSNSRKTFYDAQGRVTGRSTTDSGGSTIFYGADGRMAGRSSTSGNSVDSRARECRGVLLAAGAAG